MVQRSADIRTIKFCKGALEARGLLAKKNSIREARTPQPREIFLTP